jgi:peptidoglycan hydrolase-like protein with peptidoglycan-binding domain
MRVFRIASLWAAAAVSTVAGVSGCGHSKVANDSPAAPPDKKASGDSPPGEARHADAPIASTREGGPPLATSPGGLLKPDAVEAIQQKLAARGQLPAGHTSGKLDDPTREALRDFQRKNNLPATGTPDDLTVKKLGLDPGRIFRATQKDEAGGH